MFAKVLLPVFAVISIAAAQTATICAQATVTLNSQADATALASCSTVSGTVVISSLASGAISIDGPERIGGDLICQNAGGLTSLGSTTIGSIVGAFNLNNLTILTTLSMTDLSSVGSILWTALPALPSLNFPTTVTKATSVTISNTYLASLVGINVGSISTLQIDNNIYLETFNSPISSAASAVNINANGKNLVVTFPNLIWAANMTLRNVSSVSIPALATINGSLGFYGNTLSSIAAPNLTTVGTGSLAFVANGNLANISMPLLKSVGGAVQIANNTALSAIAFPALASVGGAIDFSGTFSTPSLPVLNQVKGGFNVQSTIEIDCSSFSAKAGNGKAIQGVFICKGQTNATTLASATGTGSSSSASSTSSKGAAASYGFSEAAAGLSVVGGLLQLLL